MGLDSLIKVAIPFVAMVVVDCSDVVISVISKAAMAKGMSNFVSVVYYNALGTLILVPYFVFFRKQRAPLTIHLIWRFFLLALIGSTGQMLYLTGVKLSSPTLASAITNLTPIFTFLLAVLARMEIIDLNKRASQVKCVGAIVAVAGAFIRYLVQGSGSFTGPDNRFQLYPTSASCLRRVRVGFRECTFCSCSFYGCNMECGSGNQITLNNT
ncbi:WAT1-related protein At5g40230 [Linum perenne]